MTDHVVDQAELARQFLELHVPGTPLLLPNPWDLGTAKLFASLGYRALATTSAGHGFTLGGPDHSVGREQALAHGAAIASATPLPVSADLENGFARDPHGVAQTVLGALDAGLVGCSIEDHTGDPADPIHPLSAAVERVAAAAEAAHTGPVRLVLTARAENHVFGRDDLADTIERLVAFADAGADVVYAPGLTRRADISRVVAEVEAPVNVLAMPGGPDVATLAELGVARISVGSAFSLVAVQAAAAAATEFLDDGTLGFWELANDGMRAVTRALGPS